MFQLCLPHMMNRFLFHLISKLIRSDRIRDYHTRESAYESSVTACIGPLQLEHNQCFVLDHRDSSVSVKLGRLALGFTVCLGEEQVRQSGFNCLWQRTTENPSESSFI